MKRPPALTDRSLGYFSQSGHATEIGVDVTIFTGIALLGLILLLALATPLNGLAATAGYIVFTAVLIRTISKHSKIFDLATSAKLFNEHRDAALTKYIQPQNTSYRNFMAVFSEVRLLFITHTTTPSMHFRDDPTILLHHFDTRFDRQIDCSQRVLALANKMHILAIDINDLSILDRFTRECLMPARDYLLSAEEIVKTQINGSTHFHEAETALQVIEHQLEELLTDGQDQFERHDQRRTLTSTTKSQMILRQLGQDPEFDKKLEEAEAQSKALRA